MGFSAAVRCATQLGVRILYWHYRASALQRTQNVPTAYLPRRLQPEFPADHRFPMDKFRLLRDYLIDSGLTSDVQLMRPELCPADILALAHDPSYISRYLSGDLSREDQRRLGLPWSEALARRTIRAVGGSLLTAEQALKHGLACHLAGGTHHAHYDYPAGFCIFNDLAVISQYLLQSGRVDKVLIFDCDVHQGDGTARILADTEDAITVSLHCEKNFPARKAQSDWDILLPMGMGDADYLNVVDDLLNYLLPFYKPDPCCTTQAWMSTRMMRWAICSSPTRGWPIATKRCCVTA